MTHNVDMVELVKGLVGYDEIIDVDIVFKRNEGGTFSYIHNYIGDDDSSLGVRQLVEIRTKDGVSGNLSHVLRTEKGMQPIFWTCKGCPDGKGSVSYWTMPQADFLYSEAREGRNH